MTVGVSNAPDLFTVCREIAASDAAQRAGLTLKQRGSRSWSKCFLHEDKTESLVFYDDGRFHCFSCKTSGDAVKLYELLYNLSPGDAARRLISDYGLSVGDGSTKALKIVPVQRITATTLKDNTERIKETRINELLTIKRKAERDLARADQQRNEDRVFDLVNISSAAWDTINRIEMMSPADLVEWVAKGAKLDGV